MLRVCCGWVTEVGNSEIGIHPLFPSLSSSFIFFLSPHSTCIPPLYPALAIDVVRSAFHALLIAAIPVAVGWFVTNNFLHPPRQMKDQADKTDSQPEKPQQHAQTTQPIQADSPLELADLALSFSLSTEHEIAVLPSLPRVPLPTKRVPRKSLRPSTASILDERRELLPTSSSSGSPTDNSPIGTPAADNDSSGLSTSPGPLFCESVPDDNPNAEIGIPLPDIIVESSVLHDHGRFLAGALFPLIDVRSAAEFNRTFHRSITGGFRFFPLFPDGRHPQRCDVRRG